MEKAEAPAKAKGGGTWGLLLLGRASRALHASPICMCLSVLLFVWDTAACL